MPSESFMIRWAPTAIKDLDDIFIYIASQGNPETALRLYLKIKQGVGTLSRFPRRCRIVPELREQGILDFREIIISPYRIFYRISERHVSIVGVLDGRRDIGELLLKRLLEER